MKRLIYAAFLLLFALTKASAQSIVFCNHDAFGDLITTDSTTYAQTDDVYDFTPTNQDMTPWHYSNNYPSPGYTFTYGTATNPIRPTPAPFAPAPQPNPTGFLTAINSDPLTTANNFALVFQMSGLLAIFQADLQAQNIPALQAHWAAAVASQSYLTNAVQQMIIGYANTYYIPLVAQ